MIGIIDVGGGLRGIFGAGVTDFLMDRKIMLDYCIGVSAGSANLCSYEAGQMFRNYDFYTDYCFRGETMSWHNFAKTGSYVDLEYTYGELSADDGEYPLDYEAMSSCRSPFVIVATNAETGMPRYFTKEDMSNGDYRVIMASSTVPVINKPYEIGGVKYLDGGLSDPIPYKKAFEDGCDALVVVLTRPKGEWRKPGKDEAFARVLNFSYPESAKRLWERADLYNTQMAEVMQLEADGDVLIVAPEDISGLKTLTRNIDQLKSLYRQGLVAAQAIPNFLKYHGWTGDQK